MIKRNLKKIFLGTIFVGIIFAIGIPSFGDFIWEIESRWLGENLINFEQLKSFCGWEARIPGEEEWEFRLRSGASALSAKVGMSIISFAVLGGFILLVKIVFWATASRKAKT